MFLKANWPAPRNIHALTTQKMGGVSQNGFAFFNLADHVGDDPDNVKRNREMLKTELALINEPIWLQQTHSTIAVAALPANRECEADASFTDQTNQICAVLTADCLPILVCNQAGTEVAAIHAGWRGLCHGVMEATLQQLASAPEELLVWLGPAISAAHYEVGNEVREQFLAADSSASAGFRPSVNQRWLADLFALARMRLEKLGVPPSAIYGGDYCSYSNKDLFYSYRRDGAKTGRMASLIWISD